jgi:uncharacterized protein YjiS (DUF1127 family)
MSGIARPFLINCQLSAAPRQTSSRPQGLLARSAALLRLWRRRIREKQALASLTPRELADFGATTADVYRELATPFWRESSR